MTHSFFSPKECSSKKCFRTCPQVVGKGFLAETKTSYILCKIDQIPAYVCMLCALEWRDQCTKRDKNKLITIWQGPKHVWIENRRRLSNFFSTCKHFVSFFLCSLLHHTRFLANQKIYFLLPFLNGCRSDDFGYTRIFSYDESKIRVFFMFFKLPPKTKSSADFSACLLKHFSVERGYFSVQNPRGTEIREP
jgi:hypothetical protein